MKQLYTTLLVVIASLAFFALLSLVAYVEQEAINKERARYARGWCNVDMGSSQASIECSRVSKLEVSK